MSEHHGLGTRGAIGVFALLLVLLGATVGAAYVPWPHPALAVGAALAIATTKAAAVAVWFMHLRWDRSGARIFFVASALWLAIFIALTMNDYLTREWLPPSRGWTERPTAE